MLRLSRRLERISMRLVVVTAVVFGVSLLVFYGFSIMLHVSPLAPEP